MRIFALGIFTLLALAGMMNRVATAEDRRSQTAATGKAAATEGKAAFVFGGVDYFFRWSENEQYEFTPKGREDLEKWTDMITINVYSSAHHDAAVHVVETHRYKGAFKEW